eukprot:Colp12_sorted_trinity150504_noHs@5212
MARFEPPKRYRSVHELTESEKVTIEPQRANIYWKSAQSLLLKGDDFFRHGQVEQAYATFYKVACICQQLTGPVLKSIPAADRPKIMKLCLEAVEHCEKLKPILADAYAALQKSPAESAVKNVSSDGVKTNGVSTSIKSTPTPKPSTQSFLDAKSKKATNEPNQVSNLPDQADKPNQVTEKVAPVRKLSAFELYQQQEGLLQPQGTEPIADGFDPLPSDTPRAQSMKASAVPLITTHELFELLYDNGGPNSRGVLIVDLRPPEQFQQSHFLTPHCVNVPADHVGFMMQAQQIEQTLRKESRAQFARRGEYGHVVLCDASGQLPTGLHDQQSELLRMFEALDKYNYSSMLQRPARVLVGGYTSFATQFPSLCSAPVAAFSWPATKRSTAKLAALSYPTVSTTLTRHKATAGSEENIAYPRDEMAKVPVAKPYERKKEEQPELVIATHEEATKASPREL